jgi:hypothetical protein
MGVAAPTPPNRLIHSGGGVYTFEPPTADIPADLAALVALGALGEFFLWDPGSYVELGDHSHAYWGSGGWQAGEAPQWNSIFRVDHREGERFFTPAHAPLPPSLVDLQRMGALEQIAPWPLEDFILVGNGMKCWWDGDSWESYYATAVSAGRGGVNTWTPADRPVPTTLAELQHVTPTPSTAWPWDLYVVVGNHAYRWTGTAWEAHPFGTTWKVNPGGAIYGVFDPGGVMVTQLVTGVEYTLHTRTWGVGPKIGDYPGNYATDDYIYQTGGWSSGTIVEYGVSIGLGSVTGENDFVFEGPGPESGWHSTAHLHDGDTFRIARRMTSTALTANLFFRVTGTMNVRQNAFPYDEATAPFQFELNEPGFPVTYVEVVPEQPLPPGTVVKVWDGAAWVETYVSIWDGAAFVPAEVTVNSLP